jgi:ring-1,2-phenylacetyl-CoA epoxidase subunit PaaC
LTKIELVKGLVDDQKINDVLHLADNSLIMGHRLSEWTGHGPVLEQDIAISNISLDLIGQSRNFYQYAATLIGNNITEDDLAYFRDAEDFRNYILVELPNGDWGKTIAKLFLFSTYQYLLYSETKHSDDSQLSAIAEKSLKEVTYHLRWSSEWVIRLGDGTDESKQRMTEGLREVWSYTSEFFRDNGHLEERWKEKVRDVITEATLAIPQTEPISYSGKEGKHTDHLKELLSEMQILQRTYPGCEW